MRTGMRHVWIDKTDDPTWRASDQVLTPDHRPLYPAMDIMNRTIEAAHGNGMRKESRRQHIRPDEGQIRYLLERHFIALHAIDVPPGFSLGFSGKNRFCVHGQVSPSIA